LHFGLFSFNRSVATQGGYFFIFLMTSLKATKTIARTNKYVISAIGIHPPFTRESKQPPPFPYEAYYIKDGFYIQAEM
jgi:hypothetical protein